MEGVSTSILSGISNPFDVPFVSEFKQVKHHHLLQWLHRPASHVQCQGVTTRHQRNIPTWEMLTTHLNNHTQAVHPAPAPAPQAAAPAPGAKSSKTAKKNRPSITN